MINCPRCEQPVDETVRTTCPLCFTPLQPEANAPQPGGVSNADGPARADGLSPAQPGAAPSSSSMPLSAPSATPLRAANTRVTLNGDIIDAPQSTQPAASPMGGSYNNRPAAPRPGYGLPTRAEPQKRSAGATVAIVLVALLLLGGGGYGGYYWWSHRAGDPKEAVKTALTAQSNEDYKTLYNYIDLTDQMKTQYPDAQTFDDKMKATMAAVANSPFMAIAKARGIDFKAEIKKALQAAKVGDAKIDGENATVPVTLEAPGAAGKSVDVHLKQVGGAWKIEADSGALGLGGMGSGTASGGGRMPGR